MATIAELIAKLGLDNSQFNKKLKDSQDKLEDFGDEAEKSGEKAKDGFDKASQGADSFSKIGKKLGPIIGAAFAADTIIGFGKAVINTTAEFQKMEAVLTNTFGSSSAAKAAMDQIVQFAATTPFSVNELTDSFVKLANRGFVPTAEEMRSLGDLASSTGKSFDQLTEAALDAMTGEFERLKEFGITSQSEGNKVKFTFKGVTTEVEKTDKALKSYILSLGNVEGVSGAMAAMSGTVGNKISALDDNITQLKLSIGNQTSGVFAASLDWLNAFVSQATLAVKGLKEIRDAVISTQASTDSVETRKEVEFLVKKLSETLPIQDAINRAVDITKQSYRDLGDDISKTNITAGKIGFTLNELEKIRVELLKEQKKETGQLSEEEKKRAEESKKFYKSAIELSNKYQEALKAEYSSTKLASEANKNLQSVMSNIDLTKKATLGLGSSMSQRMNPFGGLIAVAKQIQLEFNRADNALKNLGKTEIKLDEPVVSEEDRQLVEDNTENVKNYHKELAIANTITGMLGGTFQSAFEGMLNSGKVSFKGIIDGLKALIIKLIAAAGAALALNVLLGGIGLGGAKFGGMEGFKALFSSLSGIPKFAEGGMVTGMTTAILGDNPSGKEAIIPFEKMGSFLSKYGTGGGDMRVEVVGKISGEDIYFSGLNYNNNRNKIIGG